MSHFPTYSSFYQLYDEAPTACSECSSDPSALYITSIVIIINSVFISPDGHKPDIKSPHNTGELADLHQLLPDSLHEKETILF